MEVKRSTLDKLVCDYCGEYLSIGPVMLLKEGKSVCGRCSSPDSEKQPVLRNVAYEDLAEEILFPCQYEKHGCTEKRKFGVTKTHEAECQFKQYTCFMTEMRSCQWFGRRMDVLQHCKDKHPGQVVTNPVTFVHDIARATAKNYLLMCFNVLFLIHTKFCLQTKKLYHCVRLLGDSEHIKDYNYTLDISNGQNNLIMKGVVAAQGYLVIKDSDSVVVNTNSLHDIFGGYSGTSFKLTVHSSAEEVEVLSCCRCDEIITYALAYYNEGQKVWYCSNCIDNTRECEYSVMGCTYKDTHFKSLSHYLYYCTHRDKCYICNSILLESLAEHYQNVHADITYSAGVIFTLEPNPDNFSTVIIISSDVGRLHCMHRLMYSQFNFFVFSPILGGELHLYTCVLELQNSATKQSHEYTIPLASSYDWSIEIKEDQFMKYVKDGKFNMKLTITKTK